MLYLKIVKRVPLRALFNILLFPSAKKDFFHLPSCFFSLSLWRLIKLIMVMDNHLPVYVSQIIMLHALSLYSVTCQLYLNKPREIIQNVCEENKLGLKFTISLKIFKRKCCDERAMWYATTIPEESILQLLPRTHLFLRSCLILFYGIYLQRDKKCKKLHLIMG